MKYQITRTSLFGKQQPCSEAVREPIIREDHRTWKSVEAIPTDQARTEWLANGRNHRVDRGPRGGAVGIARDFDDEAWFITINTLEELMALYEKYGDLLLRASWENSAPTLEILRRLP